MRRREEGAASSQNSAASPAKTAQATAPAAVASPDAGTISGAVELVGTPPVEPVIPMSADPVCAAAHKGPVRAQTVVVGPDGGLANVFVFVKDYSGPVPPPSGVPVVLNQRGCEYEPHVVGVQVGQKLQIKNDDQTLHNVDAIAKNNPEFNIAQPVQGMVSEKIFDKPEIMVRLKCDVHSWMSAWVGVVANPYFAVSDSSGKFTIKGIPPGTYTLEAWQEKYGTQTQQVTIPPKGTAEASFSFNAN